MTTATVTREALSQMQFGREVAARLAAETALQAKPEELADLFLHSFYEHPYSRPLLYALQKTLLQVTIDHARAHTPYYRDRPEYREDCPPTDSDEPPRLSQWPVLRRAEVNQHPAAFLSDDVTFSTLCHTSGTTGPPLYVYKSAEEIDFVQRFFQRFGQFGSRSLHQKPITLSFPNLYHGSGIRLPSIGQVLVGGVTDDTLIEDAVKLLAGSYRFPRCDERVSILSGLAFHVKFFTSYLYEQGYDPASFGIRSVNITGGYTALTSREFLAKAWNAMLFDRFTLTEAIGGATRCSLCDKFHLDSHLVGEVLDVDSQQPISDGVGHLVLTCPYPFVQMQPLIRYATGDLIRVTPSTCQPVLTFDFLGKEKNCIRAPFGSAGKASWLIYSADLCDVLTALPDVRIYDWFSNVRVVRDRSVGSLPIHKVSTADDEGGVRVTLTIELRYAPHCFSARTAELSRHIGEHLCGLNATLAAALRDGSAVLDIRFVGPNALPADVALKV